MDDSSESELYANVDTERTKLSTDVTEMNASSSSAIAEGMAASWSTPYYHNTTSEPPPPPCPSIIRSNENTYMNTDDPNLTENRSLSK